MAEWSVEESAVIDIDETVRSVDVRIIEGHVDVVTADAGGARVEVTEVDGPPLQVRVLDGKLTVAHADLSWGGVLDYVRSGRHRRRAVVAVAVPQECSASVAVVSADAVVAGLHGRVAVRCVSGDITLDGVDGDIELETVSGDAELRDVHGGVTLKTVSGELTVVDGDVQRLNAKTVSGDIALDLRPSPVSVDVATVSGDLTVRLPEGAGVEVDVMTASGELAAGFDGLSVSGKPGRQRLTGRVGDGSGRLRGRSVSGSVALVARDRP